MLNLLVIGVLSLAAVDVSVKPLSGAASEGTLVSISDQKLVLKTSAGQQEFQINNLVSVAPVGERPKGVSAAVEIRLVDGSQFGAVDYVVTKSKALVTMLGGEKVEISTRSIHSVRWKSGDEAFDQQWQQIEGDPQQGDVVVIRKTKSLDSYEGVIYDVTAQEVQFDFDGDRISLPRKKVEGLIYFHAAGREFPDSVCRVADVDGGRWNAKSLQLAGDHLKLTSVLGIEIELPLTRLEKLDFSGGKIAYLSDLEPVSVKWKPYFASLATATSLSKLYLPRRDKSFDGAKLVLGSQSYEKGLALHSRTAIVYRLPNKFNRLLATVGIDDSVGEAGNVHLVISGDGEQLFEATVTGKDKKPLPLNVNVTGVRRLTILVDFGDGLDIGDYLNLCDVRVTK